MTLDDAIQELPIVAIVRGVTPSEAVAIGEALYAGGIRAMEVPLNSPDPLSSIANLARQFKGRMAIGAGTVLSESAVDAVASAGGEFVVMPNVHAGVIRRALACGLVPAPGFATASEAFEALQAGAGFLKLFPASTYGCGHVRQLAAVLPKEAAVWAVGGVKPEEFPQWWAAGCRGFGLGGELYRAGQDAEATFSKASAASAAAAGLAR